MADRALITGVDVRRTKTAVAAERRAVARLGLRIEHRLPHGTLVTAAPAKLAALESRGYRVKLLRDVHLLEIGAYRIDVGRAQPRVPRALDVPAALAQTWPHHLVQLVAPPIVEWIRAIEARGVDVVEPISRYGLFVAGTPAAVKGLTTLPFVAWTGAFKPAYRMTPELLNATGVQRYVSIGVHGAAALPEVRQAVADAGGTVVKEWDADASHRDAYRVLIVEIDAARLPDIARLPAVRWLEDQPATLTSCDERSAQIVAGKLDNVAPPFTKPVAGYQAVLAKTGLSGAGVVVGICDSGVDTNDNATLHPDLKGRMTFFVDRTGGKTLIDGWMEIDPNTKLPVVAGGHGTHVAGIAVGNAATGVKDSNGFLLGQGIAPAASFGVTNPIDTPGSTGTDPFKDLAQLMAQKGVRVMNNSWSHGGAKGYSAKVADIDRAVRDADPGGNTVQSLTIVFAAGNDGPAPSSISAPHEGKNTIVVGSTEAWQGSDTAILLNVSDFSARGPAADQRILPTLVAPGNSIRSTRATVDADPMTQGVQRPFGELHDSFTADVYPDYAERPGTSQAAPHVSGVCALVTEWWRKRTGGRNPSPALLKALLVVGAVDLGGPERWHEFHEGDFVPHAKGISRRDNLGFVPADVLLQAALKKAASLAALVPFSADWFYDAMTDTLYVGFNQVPALFVRDAQPAPGVPNNDQGWGRLNLPNIVLQAPDSDRGPKILSDQRHAFTANGQTHQIRVAPVDVQRPLRIALVWTDPPGAVNAAPALVNDLDLEVTEVGGNKVYKGNNLVNGFSVPGGNFDHLHNVECVYVEHPAGVYDVRVIAASVTANARPPFDVQTPWQDFALVIDNAEVPAAAPVAVVPVIDRSFSMVGSGYVDVTLTSSKQFVDHLRVDDSVAVVSFGDDAVVEYPGGQNPAVDLITGQPIRDAAKAAIDNIAFFGCTYMADGLLKARDLLQGVMGPRAIVLFSDGYDNKGCDEQNQAKPWAIDAVKQLPPAMPVYTCAMGPASDQKLLDQIAGATKGRYYYMPSIDDLFEIYNYIRGRVTGDGIIANESGMASSAKVAATVDAGATAARFTIAWADQALASVAGPPLHDGEISVRLRTPLGDLLPAYPADVRRIDGSGYVGFEVHEPLAGQWTVEIETAEHTHVRYTVGAFVTSPLRLDPSVRPLRARRNRPVTIDAALVDPRARIRHVTADAQVIGPTHSLASTIARFRRQLDAIDPAFTADPVPPDVARLLTLRAQRLAAGQSDVFGHRSFPVRLARGRTARASTMTGTLPSAPEAGSYNVVVTARGISPLTGTRFVRKDLVSVRVT